MRYKTTSDIDEAREQLNIDIGEFLRSRGWEYTCDTPGSLWLFRKAVGGKTLLVDADTALHIEQRNDPE